MGARDSRTMTTGARSTFQSATAMATGLATFGAVAGTGWVTAAAARDFQADQAAKADQAPATPSIPPVTVVEKRRPHRTVTRTVVVDGGGVTGATTVSPGSGGSVSSGGSGSSGGGGSSGPSAAAPAPAAPAPAPAPSSGS